VFRMKKVILILLLIFPASYSAIARPTAYMGLAVEATLPFVEIENPLGTANIKRGILKDLGVALQKETGFDIKMIPLPMKRMGPELLSGKISFICYTLEEWLPSVKNKVLWSNIIYHNQNLLVSLGDKPLSDIRELAGKRVGVVVNYFYPHLESTFKKYKVFRENGPDNDSNIRKLLHARVDYVVLSNLEYLYQRKLQPRLRGYNLQIENYGVKCAVSKKSPLGLKKLNSAIEAMKKKGLLNQIFVVP